MSHRLLPDRELRTRPCPRCGQQAMFLTGAQGGQWLTPGPEPHGQFRVGSRQVASETRHAPAEGDATYTLLDRGTAVAARAHGEQLHGYHACNVQVVPEEGATLPWRNTERIEA